MKYLIFFIFLWSCNIPQDGDTVEDPPMIIVDGCEYIQVRAAYDKAFTHKGNCKNLIHICK